MLTPKCLQNLKCLPQKGFSSGLMYSIRLYAVFATF
uniref:Uncharacterized protein n=1 Tax=Arundo donax TaxID=35708 RepID=A0A0A9EJ48_ARUDO